MVKSKGGNFVFPSSSFCRDHSTIQVFAKDRVAASRHQPYPEFPAGQVSAWPLSTARKTKKAVSLLQLTACFCCGAPEEIRTPGLQVRSLLLYPAELRARREGVLIEMRTACQQSWGKKTNFFERLLRGAVAGRHLVGSPHPRRLAEKAFHPIRGYRQDAGRAPTGLPDSEKEALPAPPFPAYLHKNKTAPPEGIRRGGSLVVTESPIYWAAGVPRRQRSRAS